MPMDRRLFVTTCALAPLAPAAMACARMSYVPGLLAADGRVMVSRAEFAVTPFALVDVPGLEFPLYVHRHDAERFTAVLTRCMHRGCTVEPADDRLVCPCHGSEYSNVGAVLKGPTQAPLIEYAVTTDAENVYIAVDRERAR